MNYVIITAIKMCDNMANVTVNSTLFNVSEVKYFSSICKGIYTDNEINFFDNNIETKIIINDDTLSIHRICEEYNIEINLNLDEKLSGKYYIRGLGYLSLLSKTKSLIIEKNKVSAEYELIIDNKEIVRFEYNLEYEEE